jgi:UPF0716 family protein affecting phage T7 exclusion
MFLFAHAWAATLMTLSALVGLSTLRLSLRKTFRLAREAGAGGAAP